MNKNELKILLEEEKSLYLGTKENAKQMKKYAHKRYFIFMYLYYFRLCQYYQTIRKDKNTNRLQRITAKLLYKYYNKKRNIFSYKSGVEIGLNSQIGRCCDIWHSGVVINGNIGDYCVFHGNNIIGNKGLGKEDQFPTIGNNADIGAGAVVIGKIIIAENSIIGAGAVVTKNFTESNSVIVGVPAKKLNSERA